MEEGVTNVRINVYEGGVTNVRTMCMKEVSQL